VSARYRDYAQVAAAALASPDGSARVVLLCVAQTPLLVALEHDAELEDRLSGIDPLDDVEASATYRRRVAPVLARRALSEARAKAAA
jgi:carbon-monoxide dehydrogenase medium subunit